MQRRTRRGIRVSASVLPFVALLLAATVGQGCAKGGAKAPADSAALRASGGVRADSGAVPMRVSDGPVTPPRTDDGRDEYPDPSTMPDPGSDDLAAGVPDAADEGPVVGAEGYDGDRRDGYERGDRDRGRERGGRHGRHRGKWKAKH